MADPRDAHPDDIVPDASAPDHPDLTGAEATPDTVASVAADPTSVLPAAPESPTWSGRAGVPEPATEYLRGSTPYQQPAAPPEQRTWWTPLLLGVVALGLVGIVILAAWLLGRGNDPDPTPPPIVATTNATAPVQTSVPVPVSPSVEPPPSAQLVQIPMHLVGMTQEEATEALQSLGLAYRFEFRQSPQPEGIVIASRPGPGEVIAANTTVTLVISLGPGITPTVTPTPTATG